MSPSMQPASDSTARPERRDIITPYAFHVHPRLLGLPLAAPWKRAAAIGIDGLGVAFLSALPGGVLMLFSSLVLLRWAGGGKAASRWKGRLRLGLALAAVLGMLSLVNSIRDEIQYGEDVPKPSQLAAAAIKAAPAKPELPAVADLLKDQKSGKKGGRKSGDGDDDGEDTAHSIIAWAKGLLDDLGIGLGWAALYFTVFTAWWRGQTPGKKLLGIRATRLDGAAFTLWTAFERYGGYGAGFATGLMGFIQVFWDRNRQAIHDKISETVVIVGDIPVGLSPEASASDLAATSGTPS